MCVRLSVCLYLSVCMCKYMCVEGYFCVYIYIYIYIYSVWGGMDVCATLMLDRSTGTCVSTLGRVSAPQFSTCRLSVDFNGKTIKTRQITKCTICLLTCDISKDKYTNYFTDDIPLNLGHIPSGYELNWLNLAGSQLAFVPSRMANGLQFIWVYKWAFRAKTKVVHAKIRKWELSCFPVVYLLKMWRGRISKSERSSQTEKLARNLTYSCARCVYIFDTILECCQINQINKKQPISPRFQVHWLADSYYSSISSPRICCVKGLTDVMRRKLSS